MKKRTATVLLITRSDDLQQGLGALLESIPGMKSVTVIRKPREALRWIESHQPEIILLDFGFFEKESPLFLDTVRFHSPGTKRILLVDNLDDVNWLPGNAEAILLKGINPSVVVTIMTNFLSTEGEENEFNVWID